MKIGRCPGGWQCGMPLIMGSRPLQCSAVPESREDGYFTTISAIPVCCRATPGWRRGAVPRPPAARAVRFSRSAAISSSWISWKSSSIAAMAEDPEIAAPDARDHALPRFLDAHPGREDRGELAEQLRVGGAEAGVGIFGGALQRRGIGVGVDQARAHQRDAERGRRQRVAQASVRPRTANLEAV